MEAIDTYKFLLTLGLKDSDFLLVDFLSNGMRTKEIALTVGRSVRTIESRIGILMERTKTKSQAHLVALFFRNKLIKQEYGCIGQGGRNVKFKCDKGERPEWLDSIEK